MSWPVCIQCTRLRKIAVVRQWKAWSCYKSPRRELKMTVNNFSMLCTISQLFCNCWYVGHLGVKHLQYHTASVKKKIPGHATIDTSCMLQIWSWYISYKILLSGCIEDAAVLQGDCHTEGHHCIVSSQTETKPVSVNKYIYRCKV